MGLVIMICSALLMIFSLVAIFITCKRNNSQVEILAEEEYGLESGQRLGTISPRAGGNDTSMQIDDDGYIDEEENHGSNTVVAPNLSKDKEEGDGEKEAELV